MKVTKCAWCTREALPGFASCFDCQRLLRDGDAPPRTGWLTWSPAGMVLR